MGDGTFFSGTEDGRVYFCEASINDVYIFADHAAMVHEHLHFTHHNPPQNLDVSQRNLSEESYALCGDFFALETYDVVSFLQKNERYFCFHNPSTGKQRTGIVRDHTNGLPFFPRWQFKTSLAGACHYGDLKAENTVSSEYVNSFMDTSLMDDDTYLLLFFEIDSSFGK
jgi:hypothetical protein